ncbi:MAG TPA: phosphoribosylanthranilate isomerase [Acidimicrobiales bacterium]|nr:phosphoribosylanthranilate isomerase [Acidimicrobiales bacterium]
MFVKICGTTSEQDALLAVAMGADAIGFVFAPSHRQVSTSLARDIVRRLPPEVLTVGVFRDESRERVVEIVNGMGLKGAQLHGAESPASVRWVGERVGMTIKAFPAGHPGLASAPDYGADLIMLDAASPGSGQVFDWGLTQNVPDGTRLILAGGLTADNVADAIAQVRPWGVDAATGVEAEPGRKDPRKLRAFIAAARAADTPAYEGQGEGPYDWQEEA